MPSFIYTRPQLKEFAEKTVRWPGHWEGVQTLKECGMLDLEQVEVGGVKVVPRDVLLASIEPRLRPELQEFAEKTVRWPGHWEGVQTLKECGMLDLEQVEVGGLRVVPRDVLLASIEPRLRPEPGETDVCVMYNTIDGVRNGVRTRVSYHLWDEADTVHSVSAMGRVTGYSAAIGAVMVGSGMIAEKGIVAPEDCIYGPNYEYFVRELEKRNIRILETVETLG
jgi:saccharopine dehydrogenase-like NADP-dependent oxidoreductase